jgi:hypothetical protein
MSPQDAEAIISFWEQHGLKTTIVEDGKEKWYDLCAIDMFGQLMLPCDWIKAENYDGNNFCAYLKGKPKGKLYRP